MSSFRRQARILVRLTILLGTALEYCFRFLFRWICGKSSLAERAHWLHQSCRCGLARLRIATRVHGEFPSRGILVSNHLSYLDILIYSSVAPCVFVSKKEVLSWPLFGLMAYMSGTVFIDRTRAADARRVNSEMQDALAKGSVVVLFAEGTSTNGSTVLPFRPALFEGAVQISEPVTPAHIRYEVWAGSPENDVCYWGTATFFPHLLRMLSRRGIAATIRFAGPTTFQDRKTAARQSRDMVERLSRVENSEQVR